MTPLLRCGRQPQPLIVARLHYRLHPAPPSPPAARKWLVLFFFPATCLQLFFFFFPSPPPSTHEVGSIALTSCQTMCFLFIWRRGHRNIDCFCGDRMVEVSQTDHRPLRLMTQTTEVICVTFNEAGKCVQHLFLEVLHLPSYSLTNLNALVLPMQVKSVTEYFFFPAHRN